MPEHSPARRVRDALEPLATLPFYSDPSKEAYAALGLTDFAPAYFWSRSSVLGVADAAAVSATFGVWEPGLVHRSLETARRACSLEQIRDALGTSAGGAAREVLDSVDTGELGRVNAALRRGIDAAADIGRALFAGNRAWTWPDEPHAVLWRNAFAWRELRGDSHLAACATHSISGLQANILTELTVGYPIGEYTGTRDWSDDSMRAAAGELRERGLITDDALSDDGRSLREEIERVTDAAVAPAVDALGSDLDRVVDDCNEWSQLIIERGWFPDDEKKRAAG